MGKSRMRESNRGIRYSCIYDTHTHTEETVCFRWSGLKYYLRLNLKADNKLDWSVFETVSICDVSPMPHQQEQEIDRRSALIVFVFFHPGSLLTWSAAFRPSSVLPTSINASFVFRIRSIACHRLCQRDTSSKSHRSKCAAAIFMGSCILLTSFPATKLWTRIENFRQKYFPFGCSQNRRLYGYIVLHDARAYTSLYSCIFHVRRTHSVLLASLSSLSSQHHSRRCTVNREISKRLSSCGGKRP